MSRGPFAAPLSGRELRRREARAQRLDASRPALPARRLVRDAAAQLTELARPYEPGEKDGQHIKTRLAFAALKSGDATIGDFQNVGTTVAVGYCRALDIDADLAADMRRAVEAMQSCWRRRRDFERWGFSGPEIAHVTRALDAAEVIHDASTPLQMIRAAEAAAKNKTLFFDHPPESQPCKS